MPSLYNPASLGVNIKEGITASIFSRKSLHDGNPRSPRFSKIVANNNYFYDRNGVSASSNAKNIYFLGYHKTFDIKESIAITASAQTQFRQVTDLSLTSPRTLGFTINSHFLFPSRRFKKRFFSNGIQVVLHHFKANKPIVDLLYNEILIGKPVTFEELSTEISNYGYSLSYNLNFHSHLDEVKAFSIGASASTTMAQFVDEVRSNIDEGLQYNRERYTEAKCFISFQRIIYGQFALELYGSYGYVSSISFGTGFRLNQSSILRLNVGLFTDPEVSYYQLNLNFETNRYNFRSTFGYDADDFSNFVQLTCSYYLDNSYTPTLLRLN